MKSFKNQQGQYLVDAILGIALFSAMIVFIVSMLGGVFKNTNFTTDYLEAVHLAKEGVEVTKSMRNNSFDLLKNGTYGLGQTNDGWEFKDDAEVIDKYTRTIEIKSVYRDSAGNYTEDTDKGREDAFSKSVLSKVAWFDEDNRPKEVVSELFLLPFISGVFWRESTDIDFLLGSFNGVELFGGGEDAGIRLLSTLDLDRRSNLRYDPRFISGYQKEGVYSSKVFDSDSVDTSWKTLTWEETLPEGTDISVSVRTGNTSSPDETWSDFTSELKTENGVDLSQLIGKYIQYKVTLYSDGENTPVFEAISISYQ